MIRNSLRLEVLRSLDYFNAAIGEYPWKQYSVIQGGDGGMEYAMSTLITGGRDYEGLVGVMAHELAHSWFQHVLASNEGKHAWMDEGFTSYASNLTNSFLKGTNPSFERSIMSYTVLHNSGNQEPLTTHSDHYSTNRAYSTGAYTMGSLVPYQLAYIMGQKKFEEAFRDYYYTWRFKHPEPADLEKIMHFSLESNYEKPKYVWKSIFQYIDMFNLILYYYNYE